jgi:Bacterial low temperature requirement A protein (LtrA)
MMITGIVYAALGVEDAMAHIAEHEPFGVFGATALAGGVGCYVAGTGVFAHATIRQWWVVRFGGAILLLATVAVLAVVPPIAALAIVALLLFTLPVAERRLGQPSLPGVAVVASPRS